MREGYPDPNALQTELPAHFTTISMVRERDAG
jgi:hypothetical protein